MSTPVRCGVASLSVLICSITHWRSGASAVSSRVTFRFSNLPESGAARKFTTIMPRSLRLRWSASA